MKYHPYSDIWPLMSGEDFEKLKADIAANGLRMNVITYKGMLLDGRNRERACEAAGVTVRYADAGVSTDADALNLVISLNDHRRHLSLADRAFAVEAIATLRRGSNQFMAKTEDGSLEPSLSETNNLRYAGERLGVSYGTAKRARIVRTYGTEADVEDIRSGKTTITKRATELLQTNARKLKSAKQSVFARTSPKLVSNTVMNQPIYNGPGHKYLTPQEVDPEFTGTPVEFTTKYGHVQVHTAKEMASMRFADWASYVKSLAKCARDMPDLGRPVDHNWLRSPAPSDVAKLTEALDYLRPKIAEAEALLERAVAALREKK